MNGQPEALRLAQALEYCDASVARQAINELRRMHAENASLSTGYDAARLEIKSLQAELVKESARTAAEKLRADQMTAQHRMQCNLRRELESMLAAVGAGGVEPLRKADHFRDATQMVPQGWRLVPVEPTLAMIRAGRDTPLAGEADDDSPEDYRCVYRAMLAAAPQPPVDHLRDATEMIGHALGCRANAFGKCDKVCTEAHERLAKDALDAARYRWLRDGNGYTPEECGITGGEELDELCDEGVAAQAKEQSHE